MCKCASELTGLMVSLYPRRNNRTYWPFQPALRLGANTETLDDMTSFPIAGTIGALVVLSTIAAILGGTALCVGGSDLQLALGLGPSSEVVPGFGAALNHIRSARDRSHLVPATHCRGDVDVVAYASKGFGLISVSLEVPRLRLGLKSEIDAAHQSIGLSVSGQL